MRAVLFLACCSCIFAWPGAWAARVGDAKGVRVYLNFKIMQVRNPDHVACGTKASNRAPLVRSLR